jgi:hypothetical protein
VTIPHTTITRADTTGTRHADAHAVVSGIADRLAHPIPTNGDYGPRSQRWWAQSITHGAAGVAILHASIDRTPEQARKGRSHELVRRWLGAAVAEKVSAAPGAGAWFGAPAVGFAFAHAAPHGAYRGARAALDQALDDIARERLDEAHRRIDAHRRPQLREFDLVNGLAGIGGYLLQRDPGHPLVTRVLAYMVALTEPVAAADEAGATVPGWWSADPPSGDPMVRGGHSDQSAAHGIAGPLSLLALAGRACVWVAGQRQAMQRIVSWYDKLTRITSSTDDRCRWWPQRLTWPEHRSGASVQTGPGRPSWCYSTPGIARALQLAALALGDPDGQRRAEQALLVAVTDPAQLGQLSDVSLCHGWAGTALSTWCAAQDSTDTDLAASLHQAATALTDSLTDAARPLSARPRPTDPIGLIQGAAGAALALHSLTANQVDGWARCLLLR